MLSPWVQRHRNGSRYLFGNMLAQKNYIDPLGADVIERTLWEVFELARFALQNLQRFSQ